MSASAVSADHGPVKVYIGHFSTQGNRRAMEDEVRVCAHPNLNRYMENADTTARTFVGVYDGHAGDKCSKYCRKHVHKNVASFFGTVDAEEALRKGVLKTNDDFTAHTKAKNILKSSGSTAICALMVGASLFIANVGDSRAIACVKGEAVALSSDHKPSRPDERARIETGGGFVGRSEREGHILKKRRPFFARIWEMMFSFDLRMSPYRTYPGGLAVSRSIGDTEHEFVIAEPETKHMEVTSDCDFIVLACDGVWDVLSNSDVVNIVKRSYSHGVRDPHEAALAVGYAALDHDSWDNISVVVAFFDHVES